MGWWADLRGILRATSSALGLREHGSFASPLKIVRYAVQCGAT